MARVLALATTLFAIPGLHAQGTVSAGMSGVVRDTQGTAISAASVTARHEPTGTTYRAITNASGRFSFGGVVIGGPFTVSVTAPGFQSVKQNDVQTELGNTADVSFTLTPGESETVLLDKFVVQADTSDLDGSASGAGSIIGAGGINTTATVQRSFADVARTTPFVSLRGVLSSRQQPIISAVGQNNRFNSIQVDGARINDQFGLNGSGLQAFGNPISLDTIEQFNIAISPYDVSQSGFTGASINAVTKSGTNTFHGSAYYYYTNEDFQSSNVFGSTKGQRALLEQKTKGFTLGGPILKDRLFFFINYEKFDSVSPEIAGFDPTANAAGTANLTSVNTRLATIKSALSYGSGLDFGTFLGPTATITQFNEVKLAKIDWNIISGQRLSVRYNKTEGELPASARYTLASLSPTSGSGIPAQVSPTGVTNLSSNRFTQVRNEEVWAAQLFSQWTPEFKTELRYAQNEYSQLTPSQIIFPEVRIYGFNGVAATGQTISNGALVLGTEQNRHGNELEIKTKSMSASGEYLLNNFTFSGGYDREQSDFRNLFRGNSYGVFDYASVAAFVADTPSSYTRSFYQTGTPPDEKSDFAVNGLFGQARWDATPLLSVTLGLRYDFFTSDAQVPFNQAFSTAFGIRNDGSVDGTNAISPRISFNYALTDERSTQIRGGLGHFVGRIPWVIVSNSYGNSGIGRGQTAITGASTPTLLSYLQGSFDPTNPIGATASITTTRPAINLIEDELNPPSVWRGNLAIEQKLPFAGSFFSVEAIHTRASEALFIRDLNIKPSFIGSDGRQVYLGSLATAANAINTGFSNVYAVSNISEGQSTYVAFTVQRPMKDSWSYNFTFTKGRAKDALPLGETTAGSQFGRNPVFNQNQIDVQRSAFEVRNRLQVSLAREFKIIKDWKTTVSLYYEGRTGNPYSFVYSGDTNLDGVQANDLVYVPTGVSDPVLATITNVAVRQSIMDYVNSSELASYKGKIAPRHAFTMPWINRLDLHVAQQIKIYKPAELEVFADFVNFGAWLSKDLFGYYETITGIGDNELFATKSFGAASYNATTRQLQMTGTSFTAPSVPLPNNDLSRWRIQFGARLKF